MNEKRFSLELQNNDIFDKKTNTFYCDNESICELLNEQQNIISRLETQLQKIPPKIREVWLEGEE